MPRMKVNVEANSELWFNCYDAEGWMAARTEEIVRTFEEFQASIRSRYCKLIRDGSFPDPNTPMTGHMVSQKNEGSYCLDRPSIQQFTTPYCENTMESLDFANYSKWIE